MANHGCDRPRLLSPPRPPDDQQHLGRRRSRRGRSRHRAVGRGLPRRAARGATRLVPRRRRQRAQRAAQARQPARPSPGHEGAGARRKAGTPPRERSRRRRLGLLQPDLLQGARRRRPKPAHQDNFYFGPTDIEGVVTAWIALDDATLENGCLYFGDGTNLGRSTRTSHPRASLSTCSFPPPSSTSIRCQGRRCARAASASTTATPFTSRGQTTVPAGGARAPCTTCATTSSSQRRHFPMTTRSSSRSPDRDRIPTSSLMETT